MAKRKRVQRRDVHGRTERGHFRLRLHNSAPQGVAIDYSSRNLAVVTDPGCNNVAIIKLGGASVAPAKRWR